MFFLYKTIPNDETKGLMVKFLLNSENMQKRLSNAITWLRFPLIFLIIMLHCFTVQRFNGNHDLYFKILYPFSLWLGETGVPAFFFISGYLFFISKKNYIQKLKTRIHTLIIPYFLWNIILLTIYLITYVLGYPQYINNKNIADYEIIDYLRIFWDRGSYDSGNFVPLLCPLWYIRNLMIISILSPILYYIIKYTQLLFLTIIAIWWLTTYNNAFIPQTILFFSIGAYFSIFDRNPLEVFVRKKVLFISLFIVFALGDITSHVATTIPINLQIHRLSLAFNIPVLLILADWIARHGYSNKKMADATFIVFCVHYPIAIILRDIINKKFTNETEIVYILLYFVCIIITTLVSVGIYLLLNKYLQNIKIVLSGNR